MAKHYFISYSRVDGETFALDLITEIGSGPPAVPVWFDQEDIPPGADWDEEIAESIRTCQGLLFITAIQSVTACGAQGGRLSNAGRNLAVLLARQR